MDRVLHVGGGRFTKERLQASLRKFLVVRVECLRDTVRVDDHVITWLKLDTLLFKQQTVRYTQRDSVSQRQKFGSSVSVNQQWRRMTSIYIGQLAPTWIQDGIKNRDKHAALVVLAQDIVHAGDDRAWRNCVLRRRRSEQCLGHHPKQRSRNAFAAHIGHNNAGLSTIELKMVIEVTANLFGRTHCSPK